jgi:hypothetical protein
MNNDMKRMTPNMHPLKIKRICVGDSVGMRSNGPKYAMTTTMMNDTLHNANMSIMSLSLR